jgi:hypothetical protein
VYSGQLGVIYDSQVTIRSAPRGVGGPHRESSQLPIGQLGVMYDSQPHGNALFYSHQIRVNSLQSLLQNFDNHFESHCIVLI